MFRAFSTRRNHRGYEELSDDQDHQHHHNSNNGLQAKLSRAASVPARIFSPSRKPNPTSFQQLKNNNPSNLVPKDVRKASKIHPLFALLDTRRSKKATAKPEVLRYIQYLKDGGLLGQGLK